MAPSKLSSSDTEKLDTIIKKIGELYLKVDALIEKKVKRTSTYTVPEDDNRCSQNKKNGGRCAGRLSKQSGSKKLCQLHLNKANGIDPISAKKSKKSKAPNKNN
jgi:hypothetical protein